MKYIVLVALFLIILCAMVVIVLPSEAQADATRYVKEGGIGDGTSWPTASGNLQAMIDAVEIAGGGSICVASGTYTPTTEVGGTGPRYQTFQMKNGVGIYGGFPDTGSPTWGQRDWNTNITVLSGDIEVPGDYSDNCYHIITCNDINNSVKINGFTLTAGNCEGAGLPVPDLFDRGGGIFMDNSSPEISHCTFTDNRGFRGAGIQMRMYSSPVIFDCSFENNTVDYCGAAIAIGETTPTILNCVFRGNSAASFGGAINTWRSDADITNCVFADNSCADKAGAIFIGQSSDIDIVNSTFYGNSAVTGNAIRSTTSDYPTANIEITNTIFWDGGDEIVNADGWSTFTVSHCDVQGGYSGTGNIDLDPQFMNAALGNFHLQLTSPCINAGTNSASNLPATDFEGDSRITNGRVDMGVDEVANLIPVITLSKSEYDFGDIPVGGVSVVEVYNVEGFSLTDDITITSPSEEFTVKKSADGIFTDTITLTPTAGVVHPTPIDVRYNPRGIGPSGSVDISHTSSGATTKYITVSGNGIANGLANGVAAGPGGSGTVTIGNSTGISDIHFEGGSGTGNITVILYDGENNSSLKDYGIPESNVGSYRWIIVEDGDYDFTSATIRIDMDDVSNHGFDDLNTDITAQMTVYKRSYQGSSETYTAVPLSDISYDTTTHVLTITVTSFSEFIFASDTMMPPVPELWTIILLCFGMLSIAVLIWRRRVYNMHCTSARPVNNIL